MAPTDPSKNTLRQRIKLTIIQTHPIQYWVSLYKALSQLDELDVQVIFLTDSGAQPYFDPGFGRNVSWDLPLFHGYKYTIMNPKTDICELRFWSTFHHSLISLLAQQKPDWILVDGYSSLMNWVALFWSIGKNTRIAYTSDSNSRIIAPLIKSIFKYLPLSFFFANISAFFSPSVSNQLYLLRYGAHPARIYRYPYAINQKYFSSYASTPRSVDFAWAGKLIHRKKPSDYIEALSILTKRGITGFKANLIGDGELMPVLQEEGRSLIKSGILKFLGFVNYSEMPSQLSLAHTFVFTSCNEPYGLVATEAAACGSALIVSEDVGCVGPDSSAQPNQNTLTYPTGNVQALADAMEFILINGDIRRSMQEQSIRIAKQHDVSHSASIISTVLTKSHAY